MTTDRPAQLDRTVTLSPRYRNRPASARPSQVHSPRRLALVVRGGRQSDALRQLVLDRRLADVDTEAVDKRLEPPALEEDEDADWR